MKNIILLFFLLAGCSPATGNAPSGAAGQRGSGLPEACLQGSESYDVVDCADEIDYQKQIDVEAGMSDRERNLNQPFSMNSLAPLLLNKDRNISIGLHQGKGDESDVSFMRVNVNGLFYNLAGPIQATRAAGYNTGFESPFAWLRKTVGDVTLITVTRYVYMPDGGYRYDERGRPEMHHSYYFYDSRRNMAATVWYGDSVNASQIEFNLIDDVYAFRMVSESGADVHFKFRVPRSDAVTSSYEDIECLESWDSKEPQNDDDDGELLCPMFGGLSPVTLENN